MIQIIVHMIGGLHGLFMSLMLFLDVVVGWVAFRFQATARHHASQVPPVNSYRLHYPQQSGGNAVLQPDY
jgi:hypothetical protein